MRRLTLRKESLAELGTDDLSSVVGAGTHVTCQTGLTWCDLCAAVGSLPEVTSVNAPCQTR